jgi:hypothetical protein
MDWNIRVTFPVVVQFKFAAERFKRSKSSRISTENCARLESGILVNESPLKEVRSCCTSDEAQVQELSAL